jgi:hypothetical protein
MTNRRTVWKETVLLNLRQVYCGIFDQDKKCEASRDSRYLGKVLQTSMYSRQQLDTTIMGSSVSYVVPTEML